jgi:hypothetical protein
VAGTLEGEGMEYWSTGVLEYWVPEYWVLEHYSITPSLQHSRI